MRWPRWLITLVFLVGAGWTLSAEEVLPLPREKPGQIDLSEFRTVDNCITIRIARAVPADRPSQPAYLGVHLEPVEGRLVVVHVEPDSPAARGGVRPGDVLRQVDGQALVDPVSLRNAVQIKSPGDPLKLALTRAGQPVELTVTLGATSRPLTAGGPRGDLGIRGRSTDEGVRIDRFLPDSAAEKAGLKVGDLLVKIDGLSLAGEQRLSDVIGDKRPGDEVTLLVKRGDEELTIKAKLGANPFDGGRMNWDRGPQRIWTRDMYRLGVVLIEYPDVSCNEKITPREWEKALFSRGVYNDKSCTGQRVYGSMNDYYHELSCGKFRIEGKAFDPVKVARRRAEYGNDTNRYALLTEALDKLLEREGKDALANFDGLCFIYAGGRVQTNRGNIYWPHRATLSHQGKRWPYFICNEGGSVMSNISVYCHEFGHLLGLPDLYARPENPGSEGVGVWCAMSNQAGGGQPQHFSAWCKEQLGWLKPAVIDPTIKQKLILGPVFGSDKECYKVLVRPDGSEYFLLENRTRQGFDRSLPAEGLLIWRVVDGRPILEESHGVIGPSGPRVYLNTVPFPSRANNAFTPFTTPSSTSLKGGGLPVHITNILRLPDGRVTFYIGYEYF
jgi:M6 family metalloprotease-like protein